jgi:hypothetical protein
VLLPSYLGHRCDNRPWRGRLRWPWDRIRANVPRTAPGFDLDQGDRCPIPRAERSAQPWCAVTIAWIVALRGRGHQDGRDCLSNFHVKIDGCVGQSFIRSYATLTRQTDQSDVVLSYVGVTKAV